jgi:hypothetical protein
MGFRVRDPRFANGACAKLNLTIAYLDLGDARISVDYDAGGTAKPSAKEGQGITKNAGVISIGHSGEIRTHAFALEDVRFGKGVKPDKVDFSLTSDKGVDFVILGAFLQKSDKPASGLPEK